MLPVAMPYTAHPNEEMVKKAQTLVKMTIFCKTSTRLLAQFHRKEAI